MASLKTHLPLLLAAPALASCQFSFSTGGPDYEKLENAIGDELNKSYSEISQEVSSVDCPRQDPTPKAGDTFVCTADVDGNPVRVQVNVKDDENNVNFSTMDVVYDLNDTAQGLARDISESRGFDVTVTCGEGLKVVEVGQSFECTAADRSGDTRQVKVTAGAVDEPDHWEILNE
ncbi:DUF4333 domain-containing protein [Mycolicibacterium palauense]|uniref:DUF4333 domain-containing protein n=1 Tax=Mycolicibacterium palauense TaxID=2034511 RepID=UPI001FE6BEC1|nr:DUF4333 domain-containing protein [Mycolicibacterium palauense]